VEPVKIYSCKVSRFARGVPSGHKRAGGGDFRAFLSIPQNWGSRRGGGGTRQRPKQFGNGKLCFPKKKNLTNGIKGDICEGVHPLFFFFGGAAVWKDFSTAPGGTEPGKNLLTNGGEDG